MGIEQLIALQQEGKYKGMDMMADLANKLRSQQLMQSFAQQGGSITDPYRFANFASENKMTPGESAGMIELMKKQKELNAPVEEYDSSGLGIFSRFTGDLKHRTPASAEDYNRKKYTLHNPDGSYMVVDSQSKEHEKKLEELKWLEGELHPKTKDPNAPKLVHWVGPNGENQYLNPGQKPLAGSFEVDPQVDAAVITEHTNLVNNVMDEKLKLMDQLEDADTYIGSKKWAIWEAEQNGKPLEKWGGLVKAELSPQDKKAIDKYFGILDKINRLDQTIEKSKDRLRSTRFRSMVEGEEENKQDLKDPLGIRK